MSQTKQKFLALWQKIGARGNGEKIYNGLMVAYSEPGRAYHTLEHIEHCLSELEQVRHLVKNPDAIEMALWYHDVIYDTKASDNEEQSANLAKKVCLESGLAEEFAERAFSLILSSKHHRGNPNDRDEQIFTDIDLSAWGKSWEEFQKNTKAIRGEYSWVPEDVFKKRRVQILQTFLNKPRIFNTDYFYNKYEIQARQNISRSIAELSNPPS